MLPNLKNAIYDTYSESWLIFQPPHQGTQNFMQETSIRPSNSTGWLILGGFVLTAATIFFLVQRWKQSQNRLIKKGEAPIEG